MEVRAYLFSGIDVPRHDNGNPKGVYFEDYGSDKLFVKLDVSEDGFNRALPNEVDPSKIDFYSMADIFEGDRLSGIYRLGSAEIRLERKIKAVGDHCADGARVVQYMQVTGVSKSADDLHELYDLIRAGTIRPDVSWDGPQLQEPEEAIEKESEPEDATQRTSWLMRFFNWITGPISRRRRTTVPSATEYDDDLVDNSIDEDYFDFEGKDDE